MMMSAAAAVSNAAEPCVVDRLSKRNFKRLAEYVYDRSGIKLPETKTTMVEGRLRRRLRVLNIPSLDAYCEHFFERGGADDEAVHLLNAITTNKTDFFREPKHFELLAEAILPALAERRSSPLKVWSAACSTGAEPYTLAMVIDDFFSDSPTRPYSILATDLSSEVLSVARRGVYPEAMLEPTPPALRRRWVLDSNDRAARLCRISPTLRSKVKFGRLNLMDERFAVDQDMDIIFCRNVLIYFDKPTQERVLDKLCRHLRPGGYLFLGHSESTAGMTLPIKPIANTCFQRR